MEINAYLNFDGRCDEAIAFYTSKLGAQVITRMSFADAPPMEAGQEPPEGCGPMPSDPNKVMHAALRIGDTMIMASDCNCTGKPAFQGISLALSVATPAEADRVFTALGDGGQIVMPLAPSFFSPSFGIVNDRFGVNWMVVVEDPAKQAA
jgi:PhnB protein